MNRADINEIRFLYIIEYNLKLVGIKVDTQIDFVSQSFRHLRIYFSHIMILRKEY